MRTIFIGLLLIGLTNLSFAQNEDIKLLAEVEVYASNYDYLKSVKFNDIMSPITSLERKVANFEVKSLNLDQEKYQSYKVFFFCDKGKIIAFYDNDSRILRTIEKFSDVPLPIPVIKSVMKNYPDCAILSDDYSVRYHHRTGAKKRYKITLLSNDKKLKIKTDENGAIL